MSRSTNIAGLPAVARNGFRPDYVVATDDSIPGIIEGKNAGVWTVAVLMSGNEAGMTFNQYPHADLNTLIKVRETATTAFRDSKSDYMIDTVADLFIVLRQLMSA